MERDGGKCWLSTLLEDTIHQPPVSTNSHSTFKAAYKMLLQHIGVGARGSNGAVGTRWCLDFGSSASAAGAVGAGGRGGGGGGGGEQMAERQTQAVTWAASKSASPLFSVLIMCVLKSYNLWFL